MDKGFWKITYKANWSLHSCPEIEIDQRDLRYLFLLQCFIRKSRFPIGIQKFTYSTLSIVINFKNLNGSSSLSKVKSSSPLMLTGYSILYSVYRYTEKSLNFLFLSVLPDKIAKAETCDQKSLQDFFSSHCLYNYLISSSHIQVDASFFTWDL